MFSSNLHRSIVLLFNQKTQKHSSRRSSNVELNCLAWSTIDYRGCILRWSVSFVCLSSSPDMSRGHRQCSTRHWTVRYSLSEKCCPSLLCTDDIISSNKWWCEHWRYECHCQSKRNSSLCTLSSFTYRSFQTSSIEGFLSFGCQRPCQSTINPSANSTIIFIFD